MSSLPPGVAKSLNETKVDYRLLGASGLRVSVPIVGCMSIGNPEWANWVIGPEKAIPLLKAAYDRGVNTVRSLPSHPNLASLLICRSGIQQTSTPTEIRKGSSPKPSRNIIFHAINWY